MKVVQKKICMLGDFAVGKTSLVRRFVEGRFDDKYLSTIGVKISRKPITYPDYTLNILLWDLAGGDDFSKSQSSYLTGLSGAIIVCDLTREETLAAFERYTQQVQTHNAQAKFVFVANKVDLEAERAISEQVLAQTCQALNGPYLATSAKTGQEVEKAFQMLADQLEV